MDHLPYGGQRPLESHGNLVLLGDAAHTAHFSIGSGTKLAVEDALALAACLEERPTLDEALAAYEEERRPVVASTQRAARASLEWFNLGLYLHQPARQFAFNLLTRSRRVTHDNLRLRDAHFTAAVEREFELPPGAPPMFARSGCAGPTACATGSWSHRWTCTRPWTASPATSTSSTWAHGRSAARAW